MNPVFGESNETYVPPQVSMNPVFGESNETYVPTEVSMNPMFGGSNETYVHVENTAPRYPQRLNRGVPKKSMNLILKPRPNTQLTTMCHLIG